MNIDFVKWMCEKAKGFDVSYISFDSPAKMNNGFYVNTPHDSFKIDQNTPLWRTVYYPLLLQRACEAISKNSAHTIIITCSVSIKDMNDNYVADHWRMADIDEAKEAALLWVYKQEITK